MPPKLRPALARLVALALFLVPGRLSAQEQSTYVEMRDGVLLAVDVYLPRAAETEQVPALLEITRYWRSYENPTTGARIPSTSKLDRFFVENGYAVVKVDARGSGASLGTRAMEYGREEVLDGHALIDWVVEQDWSSGKVGAYGTSYSGTTAELLCASEHPALGAVIPGWSDFDLYRSPARPYGLYAKTLIDEWSRLVNAMDDNDVETMGVQIRRVGDDPDGELRDAAVEEHADNLDVAAEVAVLEFRDQEASTGESLASASPLEWEEEIEASGVPMLVLASWMDSGTAWSALERLARFSNPQKLVILASNHGGESHASPYVVGASPTEPLPSVEHQALLRLAFFDHYLKGEDHGVAEWPTIQYVNMGAEELLATEVWPPAGTTRARFHLAPDGVLAREAQVTAGDDAHAGSNVDSTVDYRVDFGVSTGTSNVWATQLGAPVLNLDDRGAMDARMLTFTTAPLEDDLQITGAATLRIVLTSSASDTAVLAYLEDVAPDGTSRYLCEGGLRALHRGASPPTFEEADALPVVPGEEFELEIELLPTSALVRAGHRLRLALAGADADSFARVPANGDCAWSVRCDDSFVDVPVVRR